MQREFKAYAFRKTFGRRALGIGLGLCLFVAGTPGHAQSAPHKNQMKNPVSWLSKMTGFENIQSADRKKLHIINDKIRLKVFDKNSDGQPDRYTLRVSDSHRADILQTRLLESYGTPHSRQNNVQLWQMPDSGGSIRFDKITDEITIITVDTSRLINLRSHRALNAFGRDAE